METHHASSDELFHLRLLGASFGDTQSIALLRDERLKVMRLVLPAGMELPQHAVDGPITMHCLYGTIDVTAHGSCKPCAAAILCIWRPKCPTR